MGEYMRTLLNGLKAWVGGEINKLRAKIEAVATAASKTASLAAKNKADIAGLNQDVDRAYQKANAAQTAADNAQTAADNAQTAADEIKETAYRRQITWDLDGSGVDSVVWNGFHFYKVTDDVYNSHQVFTSRFTLFHTSIGERVSQMVKGFVSSNGSWPLLSRHRTTTW